MVRRVTIRLISLLLVANGIAGIAAVWGAWSMSADLISSLRQTSASVSAQQTKLVQSVRGVAVAVDDSAQATAGVSRSTSQARNSVTEATRTADNLASTFDRLGEGSRVVVFGMQPLAGMIEPFETNAEDFRRISVSLNEMSGSLADNSREMARVGDDLRSINQQLTAAAANLEALPSGRVLEESLATLEMGTRLFLILILFESLLSALTGVALAMTVQPRPRDETLTPRPARLRQFKKLVAGLRSRWGRSTSASPPPRLSSSRSQGL